ncbi:cytochrome C oxidase subunit IV family protein [Rhodococcus aetherivorans]
MTTDRPDGVTTSFPVKLFNRDVFSLLWLVMASASALTYWLGTDHPMLESARVVAASMLLIAFLKVWVVGNYFMETRDCPRPVRAAFTTWLAFSTISTIAVVLFI